MGRQDFPGILDRSNDGDDVAPPKATLRSTTEVADMMTIHNFARGARGQRVMWLCEEMGLAYAVKNHPFPVPADYRALNPLGTLPFLEDPNGVAVNESVAIMLYIAQRYGPTPIAADRRRRADGPMPAADNVRRDRDRNEPQSAARRSFHGGVGGQAQLVGHRSRAAGRARRPPCSSARCATDHTSSETT